MGGRGRLELLTPANCGLATFLVVLGAGVVALTGLQRRGRVSVERAPGLPVETNVEIPRFVLTNSVSSDGLPGPAADVFAATDGVAYLWYAYRNARPGDALRCEWYREEERIEGATAERGLTAPEGSGTFELRLSPETRPGIYRVAILQVSAEAGAAARELVSTGFAVVRGPSGVLQITRTWLEDEAGETRERFAPDASEIRAVFDFADARTGELVQCRWKFEGQDIPGTESGMRLMPSGEKPGPGRFDGRGQFVLRRGGEVELPEGTYEVELLQRGRVVGRAEFEVRAGG
ncbi:MAG: hypothetical protein ACE5O2_08300 [Armatimonadota bacterium]